MTEEIRIELQGQFGYQCVQFQQSQSLGVGSYGSVCRATLDELPRAAKLLHATFFGTHDPRGRKLHVPFRAGVPVPQQPEAPVHRPVPGPRPRAAHPPTHPVNGSDGRESDKVSGAHRGPPPLPRAGQPHP